MKLNTALVALSLFGTASAFAPQHMAAGTQRASLTELEMANGAKRKAALKVAKKVAGAVGGVALATSGLPPAARAAEAAVESAKGAKDIFTVGAHLCLPKPHNQAPMLTLSFDLDFGGQNDAKTCLE